MNLVDPDPECTSPISNMKVSATCDDNNTPTKFKLIGTIKKPMYSKRDSNIGILLLKALELTGYETYDNLGYKTYTRIYQGVCKKKS